MNKYPYPYMINKDQHDVIQAVSEKTETPPAALLETMIEIGMAVLISVVKQPDVDMNEIRKPIVNSPEMMAVANTLIEFWKKGEEI